MVEIEKIQKLFEQYDFNKNGLLDRGEFLSIFKQMLHDIGQYIPDKRHDEVAEEGFETSITSDDSIGLGETLSACFFNFRINNSF